MPRAERDAATIIVPVEQRIVSLPRSDGEEVLAARIEISEIYLPIRPICTALGINWATQYRKIKADEILFESTLNLRMQTRGGAQVLVCMDVEAIPGRAWKCQARPMFPPVYPRLSAPFPASPCRWSASQSTAR